MDQQACCEGRRLAELKMLRCNAMHPLFSTSSELQRLKINPMLLYQDGQQGASLRTLEVIWAAYVSSYEYAYAVISAYETDLSTAFCSLPRASAVIPPGFAFTPDCCCCCENITTRPEPQRDA